MAGPKFAINYVSQGLGTLKLTVPSWQQAFTGDAAATVSNTPPKGFKRRHRMLRGDTTGREYKLCVGDVTLTAWTAANGAAVASPPTIPGAPDTAFHYGGRIGEKDLVRN
jgi:hypothetical protein